ncbi:MAG: orotidine-5'-phosphate decarboxylase [Alphaproteobacteria bacterium]|jgi:orotidine-5'-phosphate decarboxylase|nr:orotidine-5'-phosphate decarboxylase [Rhodospirillaceae bacterium]MDP6021302.1 orotidine-5'-phosphate decarboxylase [Alphaproteobacteria bacterium]MDP6254919.1 orotidine-5'-phosphate decarboxylase [Alphaproteobacteria bacterium]MDP7053993.1 orotidine-5'-phosphate decarboxylase [Alphaproteobacteria bacterium]MDP7227304.1 orotidine-5'-phosphate decarboxylase [Alphaproteobacteria bacterium]|tara:strand:+ start:8568 stop:9401 length:834 start_codon:yes stop_codon:yes gene_type:complete
MVDFLDQIAAAEKQNKSFLCVGLDPDPGRMPEHLAQEPDGIFRFCKGIVDATHDLVLAFKPQIAYFAAQGAEEQLRRVIEYIHANTDIPVILDAKRADISSTSKMYAEEAFDVYGADALTVNPYFGMDSIQPFLDYKDKGIIILCRTSNPGSAEIQNIVSQDGETVYEVVARKSAGEWNMHGNILLVAGATHPDELRRIREIVGGMTLLIPGVGAQGGDIPALIGSARGGGVIINSSRAVIYAGSGTDYADAARAAARETRDAINDAVYAICNDIRV